VRVAFTNDGWADYVEWQARDKKTLRRINALIRGIGRDAHACIGAPEPLRGDWAGWWSRAIDDKNRLIYHINGELLEIAQCAGHYDDH